MDLIYKISAVYLYDHQLDHDFIIPNMRSYHFTGGESYNLPYDFSGSNSYGAFSKIHSMCLDPNPDIKNIEQRSISFMNEACIKNNLLFIKNDGFLTIEKFEGTHLPNYNAYNIYWNETKSGINIFDYEIAHHWNIGKSSCSSYRIYEYKMEREKQIRDNKIKSILA